MIALSALARLAATVHFPPTMKRYPSSRTQAPGAVRERTAGAEAVFSLGHSEAKAIAEHFDEAKRTSFAREFCTSVVSDYWNHRAAAVGCPWLVRDPVVEPHAGLAALASRLGLALQCLSGARAGHLVGQLYTTLLPGALRKELGAFYTPPPLVERLLDMVTDAGFDWRTGSVIDPACGGAAFLSAVAPRLANASAGRTPSAVMADVEKRLVGVELDPFSAWMALVLLDIAILPLSVKANRRLPRPIVARDALDATPEELGLFDLVIGNPPYGKVKLSTSMRKRYERSLFGHANLYGLFTELAVRLARNGGLVAYVTPTSFLGGEYFKRLRAYLCAEAPLAMADFVQDREGVFDGVLQETMLAVFTRSPASGRSGVSVHTLHTVDAITGARPDRAGDVCIPDTSGTPWILPRSSEQASFVRQLNAMPRRLKDYGFSVSTGQLVWNRHRDQLRARWSSGCCPIVWAESVSSGGVFQFQAARRNHLPYLCLKQGQEFLVNSEPCILLQRTTAKEQHRRLVAAVIPNSFIVEYPGFAVENHLNMIVSAQAKPAVALSTLATLLNSTAADRAFRCMNGSVAVSAYELNSLPMPSPEQMKLLQQSLLSNAPDMELDALIESFYQGDGLPHEHATPRHSAQRHQEMVA